MKIRTCLALVHPEIAVALSLERSHVLLAALGAPSALVATPSIDLAFAHSLFVRRAPAPEVAGWDLLAQLGSVLAREAILEASDDVNHHAPEWADEPPVDLAALLVIAVARHEAWAERIVERALVRLGRFLAAPTGYELSARRATKTDAATFERALASISGLVAPPWVVADDDGTLHAALIWAEGREAFVAIEDGVIRRHELRVLRADVLRFDVAAGRIHVRTARPERIVGIAESLALAVFGDDRAFFGRPAFSLRRVLELGAEGIAKVKLPAGVKSLHVQACQCVLPGGGREEARGVNSLASIEERARVEGGYLSRATLRLSIDGAPRHVDAYLELPNLLGIREPRWAPEIRAALVAIGVLSPGALADDVSTFADWGQASFRWIEVAGDEGFRRMVAIGLLVQEDPKNTHWVASEAMRPWGHSIRTIPLQHALDEGREYALADDRSVRARTVGEADRTLWKLDRAKLCETLRSDLGLEEPSPIELPAGVVEIGVQPMAGTSLRVFYLMVAATTEAEKKRVAGALTKATRGKHAVVFVPRGRKLGRELVEVELDVAEQFGLKSWRGKMALAVAELELPPKSVPAKVAKATRPAALPGVPEIAIDGTTGAGRSRVFVNGERYEVQDRLFRVLLRLIVAHLRRSGAWTAHAVLGAGAAAIPSRIRTALESAVPKGFKLVESDRAERCRLNPAVVVGEIDWGVLAEHSDEGVQEMAKGEMKRGGR